MSGQFEQPILDPSALVGSLDPTMSSQVGTIAELDTEQRANLIAGASHKPSVLSFDLVPGDTIESQCNKNYSYLNGEGISLEQFTGAVNDLVNSFDDTQQVTQRRDGGTESFQKRGPTISGQVKNLLTGEVVSDEAYDARVKWPDQEGEIRLITGRAEVELLEAGVFKAPGQLSGRTGKEASRAEQILMALRATERGQEILRNRGVGDPDRKPEQPIALVQDAMPVTTEVAPQPSSQAVESQPASRRGRIGRAVLGLFGGRR